MRLNIERRLLADLARFVSITQTLQGGSGRGWELSSPDPDIHLKKRSRPVAGAQEGEGGGAVGGV